jgi:hypothetical protein
MAASRLHQTPVQIEKVEQTAHLYHLTWCLNNIVGKKFVPNAGEFFTSPVSDALAATPIVPTCPNLDSKRVDPLSSLSSLSCTETRLTVTQCCSGCLTFSSSSSAVGAHDDAVDTGVWQVIFLVEETPAALHHTAAISSWQTDRQVFYAVGGQTG